MSWKTTLPLLLATTVLAACQPSVSESNPTIEASANTASSDAASAFLGSDIRAEKIGGDFSLLTHDKKRLRLSDNHEQIKVIIFGYTHCPDICPTNLQSYKEALQMLGEDAKKVQVYFITIDPDRDTPENMARYIPFFDETFIGLWPSNRELEQLKKDWRVTATKVPREDGMYFMDHSTGTYLLDRQNLAVVYEPHGVPAKQIATDLKILIESKG